MPGVWNNFTFGKICIMKRFRRWTFKGLTVLALLSCVGISALWISSYTYRAGEWGVYSHRWPHCGFRASARRGEYVVLWTGNTGTWMDTSYYNTRPNRLGFGFNHSPAGPVASARNQTYIPLGVIQFPLWLPCGAMIIIAGLLWRLRSVNRIVPGLCAVCGYDLRATSDRCPECGTILRKVKT
jgi:hypothetical protein